MPQENKIQLSIIIPVFNEENFLNKLFNELTQYFNNKDTEVIIIDDGSTDSSNKITVDQKSETSLKSPLVGTAYLSPEPGSKQFIEIGQNVKIGQVLLIIEAMKTMNEIVADRNGTVKKIYVKNETPVEFGEPLVLIE